MHVPKRGPLYRSTHCMSEVPGAYFGVLREHPRSEGEVFGDGPQD